MKKILASALATLLLAAGLGACGSSSNETGTSATTQSVPRTAAKEGEAQTRQLAAQAQQVLDRLALTARAMSGKAPAEQQRARQTLGRLGAEATSLAQRAKLQLRSSNPARAVIVQAGQQGEQTAKELQRLPASPEAGKALRMAQTMLSQAAGSVGSVSEELTRDEARKVAGDLEALARQATH